MNGDPIPVDPLDGQIWKTGSTVLVDGELCLITNVTCREFPWLQYDLKFLSDEVLDER